MSISRVGLIYDHTRLESVGQYCLRALLDLVKVEQFHPEELSLIPPDSCDLFLYVDDGGWSYAWREELRPVAYWATNTHLDFERSLLQAEQSDWTFAAQRDVAEALSRAGIPGAEWLPFGCDPLIYRSSQVAKERDTCFIGRLVGDKRTALWKLLVENFPTAISQRVYCEEAARLYSSSRSAFNCSVNGEVNWRIFEAAACASLVITDALETNGLDELFQDGVHLATYCSADELLDKLRYYLANEQVCDRIARAARLEALSRHTFAHRMQRIFAVVEQRSPCRVALLRPDEVETTTIGESETSGSNLLAENTESVQNLKISLTDSDSTQPCLSLCMIVRDATRTLGPCLESIRPWVDELIIVDTGSRDETKKLAHNFGARIFEFPWCDDFSAARNESLRHARGRWMFWMDADDTISASNGSRLRELAQTTRDEQIWAYVVQVHCPGPSTDGPEDVTIVDHVKLLRNRPEIRFDGRIHEQVLSAIRRGGGSVAWSDLFVVHSGSDWSAESQAKKLERDLRILLLELVERPEHPFTLFNLGMTFSELRAFDMATRYLRKSLAVAHPDESHVRKAYALLVHAHAQANQLDLAWDALHKGLEHFPSDVELRFREGLMYQLSGSHEEAERAYMRVLSNTEQRHFTSVDRGIAGYKARQNLAQLYVTKGEHAKAELQWKLIASEHPTYTSAWQGFIDALMAQGKVTEALVQITRLEKEQATRTIGLYLRGRFAQLSGEWNAARNLWERALREAPQSMEPLRSLCQLLFEHGEPEAAATALESLAERDRADAAARHNLGLVYLRLNRPDDAVAVFNESLKLRGQSAATALYLGHALYQVGKINEARAAWQLVLRQDPRGPHADEARQRWADCATAVAVQ